MDMYCRTAEDIQHPVAESCDCIYSLVWQMTMVELTHRLSAPGAGPQLNQEAPPTQQVEGRRRKKKEDKHGLMDNMIIESLPPTREEGPRVFIISWEEEGLSGFGPENQSSFQITFLSLFTHNNLMKSLF